MLQTGRPSRPPPPVDATSSRGLRVLHARILRAVLATAGVATTPRTGKAARVIVSQIVKSAEAELEDVYAEIAAFDALDGSPPPPPPDVDPDADGSASQTSASDLGEAAAPTPSRAIRAWNSAIDYVSPTRRRKKRSPAPIAFADPTRAGKEPT